MEFCIVFSKWYNYDTIISLFHKNFDKLHLGIIDFPLAEIQDFLKLTDVSASTM